VSRGRVFVLFDGRRREDLLELRDRAILLARSDDVPEVEFDSIRLRLANPEATPDLGRGPLRIARGGETEVSLDPPLSADAGMPRRLRIDIDVRQTLADGGAGAGSSTLDPVVLTHTDDDIDSDLPLAPTRGTVRSVDRAAGRFLFEARNGGGVYWTATPAAGVFVGQQVLVEGSLRGDASLRADRIVASDAR
jgi:hypothetical protein